MAANNKIKIITKERMSRRSRMKKDRDKKPKTVMQIFDQSEEESTLKKCKKP